MSKAQELITQIDTVNEGIADTFRQAKDAIRPKTWTQDTDQKLAGAAAKTLKKGVSAGKKAADWVSRNPVSAKAGGTAVAAGLAAGAVGAAALKRRHTLKKAGVLGKGGLKAQKKVGDISKAEYKTKKKAAIKSYKAAKERKKYMGTE